MCSMCEYCGAGLTESKVDKKNLGNENDSKRNAKLLIRPCKLCAAKLDQENVKWDGLSPYATPLVSPTTSLSSADDSYVSTCSEFSFDVNSFDRSIPEEGTVEGVLEDFDAKLNGQSQNPGLKYPESWIGKSDKVMENNFQERNDHDGDYMVRDVENVHGHNFTASLSEEIEYPLPDDLDIQTWQPPEPENPQDDVANGVACNDDDDDEGIDSVNWSGPTSLSYSKDEISGSHMFKEEKLRAMEEVINGKFKTLVSQLLKSVGVSSSNDGDKSWVEIITSLSREAASFLKPDAIWDNALNPDRDMKVKCIASGSRSQSQLIRGLVFKKHAAHKHMPTKYENARLLPIRGMLGHSCSGLSSFDSMEQEKSYLKSTIELIEMCHPNVILVEKTVSRDILESILAKGMTLVLDMKLHRLERVARCTGSPILSCDNLNGQKLKHCKNIYFEKFVEEHARFGEGGKRPVKTLMFIEGCPTRLGCTILLRGSCIDELKRIKCVLRHAVVTACQLILETSFLVDQQAMFSTIPLANVTDIFPTNHQSHNSPLRDLSNPSLEYPVKGSVISGTLICNGFHERSINGLNSELQEFSPVSYEPYNPAIFSGFSAISYSLKKVIGKSFLFGSSSPYESLSVFLGFNEREPDGRVDKSISILEIPEDDGNCTTEAKSHSDEEKSVDGGRSQSLHVYLESNGDKSKEGSDDRNQIQSKDYANAVLDSESILVLMSSRNALTDTICQQSHFSHIMFYKNYDVPLGKFLQDSLLNQTKLCGTCHDLPEAHFYYYVHHNKQLSIQVKRLPQEKHLAGEGEGKLWMWSRCGKCRSGSTKRVLISTTARSLSFGKFLELGLSRCSSSSTKSSCGHSPDWDFLYFFGYGHMIAMFRYSSLTMYTVSMPPQKLQFSGATGEEWLFKETENVYMKGISLFTAVENCLRNIKVQFDGSILKFGGSIQEFSGVEEMLKEEREEFELNIENAVAKVGNLDRAALKFLSLNRLMWDLLIESCVWDRRLYSLISLHRLRADSDGKVMQDYIYSKGEGSAGRESWSLDKFVEDGNINGSANVKAISERSVEANELLMKEIPISGPLLFCHDQEDPLNTSNALQKFQVPTVDDSPLKRSSEQELNLRQNFLTQCAAADGNLQDKDFVTPNYPVDDLKVLYESSSVHSPVSNLQDSNEWFWKPFANIRQISIQDLQERYLPKFKSVSSSITDCLPTSHQLINEEGTRLHIPLRTDYHIVSDYEGELSSIIACALALLKDSSVVAEVVDEEDRRESGIVSKTTEDSHDLAQSDTITFPYTFSSSSSDSDSVHSTGSTSSEESRVSLALDNHSIEISLGQAKSLGRERYSVVCHYANEFHELRNWCCPSEIDYIASLSRCRNWDAKGGKSKSIFAKTLDDRFIIKEIKKTELDSFLEFAPLYFKYMKESFESGSQTCLAKILGIYQVTRRHTKSGKEHKHDLMVMENLTYNRNINRKYDLKGSLFARYSSAVDGDGDVLLDQNFVNDMNSSPLYVSNTAKRYLERAIWNDTTFLNSINVMDYSLFVGVDSQGRELACGIIDYLRQYTWDKHLETWMKASLVVPKNVLPTVISPKEYKKRFRKFMSTHFLSVPDCWCFKKSSDPCKLCGSGKDYSALQNLQDKGW